MLVFRSFAIALKPGRYMSIENGPIAERRPSNRMMRKRLSIVLLPVIEFIKFLFYKTYKFINIVFTEIEGNASSFVDFRDCLCITQFQSLQVITQSFLRIFNTIFPDSDSAQLCHTIFYIIERNLKYVKLFLPEVFKSSLMILPIHRIGPKAFKYSFPFLFPFSGCVIWVGVNPVLKLIDSSYPRQGFQNIVELITFGSSQIFFILKKHIPMRHGNQLHGHGSQFCHFAR